MEFWASSETYLPASAGVESVRQTTEPILNRLLAQSRFADVQIRIRYIPIVMPSVMHEKYTPRSQARLKQRILDCAPQIDYDVYLDGDFPKQLDTYLDGIKTAFPMLLKFGLTLTDVSDLKALLSEARDLALASYL